MAAQNVFIAHPESDDQASALEAVMKALKIKFEIAPTDEPYDQEFVDMVLQGDEDFKAGGGTKITIEELNNLWK